MLRSSLRSVLLIAFTFATTSIVTAEISLAQGEPQLAMCDYLKTLHQQAEHNFEDIRGNVRSHIQKQSGAYDIYHATLMPPDDQSACLVTEAIPGTSILGMYSCSFTAPDIDARVDKAQKLIASIASCLGQTPPDRTMLQQKASRNREVLANFNIDIPGRQADMSIQSGNDYISILLSYTIHSQ